MNRDAAAAAELLNALAAAWRDFDRAALVGLFEDDPETTYLDAGEIDPWISIAAIRRAVDARQDPIRFEIHAPRPRRLAPGLASVFAVVDKTWGAPSMTERVRVTLVARQSAQGWKIVHYAEAPKAPLLELEAYYQAVAADGLDAIPPRPWSRS